MAGRRAHAPGMSPLQALIVNRMRQRGWSPKQVEDRGVAHATLHRYMNPVELSQPPRKAVLQSLADALELPLAKVQQAAVESVSYDYTRGESPEPAPLAEVSSEDAIAADRSLHPAAKAHLLNQLQLLRLLPPDLVIPSDGEAIREREAARHDEEMIARIVKIKQDQVAPRRGGRKG